MAITASFSFPDDEAKLKCFLSEYIDANVMIDVSGVGYELNPSVDGNGFLWYTNPYGVDGAFSFLDETGLVSSEVLFNRIWKIAKFWSAPRDENGYLLYSGQKTTSY